MKMKHNNKGFSLVELIVVIAIMAILGGVGTAGYTKYIEQTNKKADMTLVGNIMRAIETGTNSTMFVNDDSKTFAATVYPVGFVTLTKDGTAVMISDTDVEYVETECVFETIENIVVETKHTKKSDCVSNDTSDYYEISSGNFTYCKTHSPAPVIEDVSGKTYVSKTEHSGTNIVVACLRHKWTNTLSSYPDGAIAITNQQSLYSQKNSDLCELAYARQYGIYKTPATQKAASSNALYDSIDIAFGNVDGLKLLYDGWTEDEGVSYSTFYTYATTVFDKVSDKTQYLVEASNGSTPAGQALALAIKAAGKELSNFLTEGTYESSADLLDSFSTFVSAKYSASEWDRVWAAASRADDEYTFEIGSRGGKNDYIWAARTAYNTAFASYCDAVLGIDSKYLDLICDYGEKEYGLIDVPSVVNTEAFNKTGDDSLQQDFINKDSSNGASIFQKCKDLYDKYIVSDACISNGQTFYSTTKTLDATGDLAINKNNGFNGDYFAYYNSYLNEMAKLYNEAKEAAGKGGIVIIVEVVNGEMKCTVSPSAANPRNK